MSNSPAQRANVTPPLSTANSSSSSNNNNNNNTNKNNVTDTGSCNAPFGDLKVSLPPGSTVVAFGGHTQRSDIAQFAKPEGGHATPEPSGQDVGPKRSSLVARALLKRAFSSSGLASANVKNNFNSGADSPYHDIREARDFQVLHERSPGSRAQGHQPNHNILAAEDGLATLEGEERGDISSSHSGFPADYYTSSSSDERVDTDDTEEFLHHRRIRPHGFPAGRPRVVDVSPSAISSDASNSFSSDTESSSDDDDDDSVDRGDSGNTSAKDSASAPYRRSNRIPRKLNIDAVSPSFANLTSSGADRAEAKPRGSAKLNGHNDELYPSDWESTASIEFTPRAVNVATEFTSNATPRNITAGRQAVDGGASSPSFDFDVDEVKTATVWDEHHGSDSTIDGNGRFTSADAPGQLSENAAKKASPLEEPSVVASMAEHLDASHGKNPQRPGVPGPLRGLAKLKALRGAAPITVTPSSIFRGLKPRRRSLRMTPKHEVQHPAQAVSQDTRQQAARFSSGDPSRKALRETPSTFETPPLSQEHSHSATGAQAASQASTETGEHSQSRHPELSAPLNGLQEKVPSQTPPRGRAQGAAVVARKLLTGHGNQMATRGAPSPQNSPLYTSPATKPLGDKIQRRQTRLRILEQQLSRAKLVVAERLVDDNAAAEALRVAQSRRESTRLALEEAKSIQEDLLQDLERTNDGLFEMISRHRTQLSHERRHDMKKDSAFESPALLYQHQEQSRHLVSSSPSAFTLHSENEAPGVNWNDKPGNDVVDRRHHFTAALNSACWKGKLKAVEQLLEVAPVVFAGAADTDTSAASVVRQPIPAPLHDSSDPEEGRGAALRAALNAHDEHGYTALICAVHRDNTKVVDILLSHNARPDVTDRSRCSALHVAAQRKNLAVFMRLLAAGGDIMAPNCYNLSALQELQLARPKLFPINVNFTVAAGASGTGGIVGAGYHHHHSSGKHPHHHHHHHSTSGRVLKAMTSSLSLPSSRQEYRRHEIELQQLGAELAVELGVGRMWRDSLSKCAAASGVGTGDVPLKTGVTIRTQRIRDLLLQGARLDRGSAHMRSLLWHISLGVLPPDASCWSERVRRLRNEYEDRVNSKRDFYEESLRKVRQETPVSPSGLGSAVSKIASTRKTVYQIHVDLNRMRSDIPVEYRRNIARILYVFSESNPGLSYVQGMHDVACVIFHVFFLSMEETKLEAAKRSHNESEFSGQPARSSVVDGAVPDSWQCLSLNDVEADTYAAFSHLMFQMRGLLPSNFRGLQRNLAGINDILQSVDPELWEHFRSVEPAVDMAYFAVPWLVTLCSQGVAIDAVVDIWDVLLNVGSSASTTVRLCEGGDLQGSNLFQSPASSGEIGSTGPKSFKSAAGASGEPTFSGKAPQTTEVFLGAGGSSAGQHPPPNLNIQFLLCFCVAMLRSVRSIFLMGGFAANMAVAHGLLRALDFQAEAVLAEARRIFQQLPSPASGSDLLDSSSTRAGQKSAEL